MPTTDAVITLETARASVVRIVAEGSYVDPEFGVVDTGWSGSGFILDEAGTVVTNNHVVTGAALLRVHVEGYDDPVNARVLGVSECSDLAVIDLDGDGYQALRWSEGDPEVGVDVYAAGYPLGDPEFTMTRGIVSKADAYGETSWASVDAVLEHDATINPGNSGGPLLSARGEVIAVNYAGNGDAGQSFAIARDEAKPLVEELRSGRSVDSLGINAVAFTEDGVSGIYVHSVESGSPADDVGIRGGDVVLTLEGTAMGRDGTMSAYCDVLRTKPGAVMAVEVFRPSTGTLFEGRLNGTSPLTAVGEIGAADPIVDEPTPDTSEPVADGFTVLVDDSGRLSAEVPTSWSDVDGSPFDGEPALIAAPDLDEYSEWWGPGVELYASWNLTGVSLAEVIGWFPALGQCVEEAGDTFDLLGYVIDLQMFGNCGGTGTSAALFLAESTSGDHVVLGLVQMVNESDADAAYRILETFTVTRP